MSTKLGFVKLYWSKEDFGKMAKLKDINNLAITKVEHGNDETVEITITTPMDNVTTSRVKSIENFNNGIRRYKNEPVDYTKSFKQTIVKNDFGEEIVKDDYYLSIDLSRDKENCAILFKETSDMKLKIIQFIKIKGLNLDDISDYLINILKPYKGATIIIPEFSIGYNLIDFLNGKNFNSIINVGFKDLQKINEDNINLIENNELIYELLADDFTGKEQFIEFLELHNELKNLDVKMTEGYVFFERKSKDISNYKINALFNALSKLEYTL